METIKITNQKQNIEATAIRVGIAVMEFFGIVMLFCGLFEIRLF